MSNPLLDFSGLPKFSEIKPEHVGPAITDLISSCTTAITTVEEASLISWETIVAPLDEAVERLNRAWGIVCHLRSVTSTPALRQAHSENLQQVSCFYSALGENPLLYERFAALEVQQRLGGDEVARRRILTKRLQEFRLSGADLPTAARTRLSEIHSELAALAARFSNNLLEATDSWELYLDDATQLAGIPADQVEAFRADAEAQGRTGYRLTLQAPCYLAVRTYADDRRIREILHRAYVTRASETGMPDLDNGPVMAAILRLRCELADLLQLADYGEYSLATKMASSPSQVLSFLRDLGRKAYPTAIAEHEELKRFAQKQLGIAKLEPWDVAYASERLKQARFSFSSDGVKAYFREDKVVAGLFALVRDLYGIEFRQKSAQAWHEDVQCFDLVDRSGVLIGELFMDLYARESKLGGAWMSDCRKRCATDAGIQTPAAYIVCNFGKGNNGRPATFAHDEVVTLFHEMGHALHELLTEQTELGVSGISGVEWDAVELPSQFMENFCWEWDVINAISEHVHTGASLPRWLFERMLAAKNFQTGLMTLRQVELSLFDMELHRRAGSELSAMDLWTQIREEFAVVPVDLWSRFPNSFSHIFSGGYAAGYYGYLWAETMSTDAYAAFADAPDERGEIAHRFQSEILARGGSRPAIENFMAFRGRAADLEAFVKNRGLAQPTPALDCAATSH